MKYNNSKRILSLLFAFVMIFTTLFSLGSVPVFGATDSGYAGEDITWSYDSGTTTLTLSGTGATYDFRATNLGSNKRTPWESYKPAITKVVVNEGITVLGDYAFYNCVALTSVQLPSTLTAINGMGTMETSYGCFQNCTALKLITLPNNLETIGTCAFKGCTSLRLIKFPDSLKELSYGAFCDCTSLATVTFGEGITNTGRNAFYNSGVKKINFSSTVTTIDSWCFFNTKIVSVEIPEQITSIGTRSFADCVFITDATVYNRDCEFKGITGEDPFNGSNQELTIHGYNGSTAEVYATTHNYAFASLDDCVHANTETVVITPPGCETEGTSNIVCSDCGEIVRTGVIEPTGHTYEETSSDDQTEANGHIFRTYTCTVCGNVYTSPEHQKAPEGSATDYIWVDGTFTYTNTSNCTTAGYERYVCNIEGCSQKENHLITSPDHNVTTWTEKTAPTCTEEGVKVGKCAECGTVVEEAIPPTGHTLDTENPISVDDQTDTDGHIYKECRCTVCGDTVLVKEHSAWIEGRYTPNILVAVTCTIDGRERDTCDICGETRDVVIKAVGTHDFVLESTVEATCTVRSSQTYKCTQCANKYTTYGDALGHDYIKSKSESVEPTCTEQGYDQLYCSRCSSSKREVVAAKGHRPDEDTYVITVQPTCEKDGEGQGYCTVCDIEYTEVLPALGHEYENITKSIDNKPGHSYVTPTCVRCGNTTPATISHDEWIEGYYTSQVVNEPGCIVKGNTVDTCTICNANRNVATDALGHTFNYTGSLNPINGNMVFRCRYCRLVSSFESDGVLKSWDMAKFLTAPGRAEAIQDTFLDANGDDCINAKDYAMIYNAHKEYLERAANGEFDDQTTNGDTTEGGTAQ